MFCTKCGKKNDDHSKYCEYCGAKLEASPGRENRDQAADGRRREDRDRTTSGQYREDRTAGGRYQENRYQRSEGGRRQQAAEEKSDVPNLHYYSCGRGGGGSRVWHPLFHDSPEFR
ncbi:MAG: zinc ribbon domain-containing protein [Eisenbergiella sp.]